MTKFYLRSASLSACDTNKLRGKICFRLTITTFMLLVVLIFGSSIWAQDEAGEVDASVKIPRGTQKNLDEVLVPAMQANRNDIFMSALPEIIERCNREQLDAVEKYCEAKGVGSVRERFADLALLQIEQGQINLETKLDLTLAVYLADELARKVEDGLELLANHPVMADPLDVPDDWQQSEQLFWETHVFRNEFLNAQRLVDFGVAVLKPHHRRAQKSGDAEVLSVFQRVEKLAKLVPETFRNMVERDSELRLIRFDRSSKKLLDGGDFETMLIAAMCMELDAERLAELFQNNSPESFARVALQDPNFPETIQKKLKEGRQVGDDVSLKAILLRSGLHFWLRGRYGEGQLANGLLKSPAAMTSTLAMEGLYMPKIRPKPISGYHDVESSEPGYDRRHYYTWAVEHRPLIEDRTRRSSSKADRDVTSARSTGKFW